MAFSPDGKILASASLDGTVRLSDVVAGEPIQRLKNQDYWARSVIFSPDGKALASISANYDMQLLDVATGELIRYFGVQASRISSAAISPNGKLIASAFDDNTVWLWDLSEGKPINHFVGHKDWVSDVTFDLSGEILASGSQDGTVRLWDVLTGKEIQILRGHDADHFSVVFSPDNKSLALLSYGDSPHLWDIFTGAKIQYKEHHWVRRAGISDDMVSSDGRIFIKEVGVGLRLSLAGGRSNFLTLLRGRRGTWISCRPETDRCLRHDDGTLLQRRRDGGRFEPIPPPVESPRLELISRVEELVTEDGKKTEFVLKLKNTGSYRAFWIRIQRAGKLDDDPFGLFLPPTRSLIEPGETANLTAWISTHSTYEDPQKQTVALNLQILRAEAKISSRGSEFSATLELAFTT